MIESDPVYFDTNESNPNGAIPADQWVTLEIPLSAFGAIDPSTVVGCHDLHPSTMRSPPTRMGTRYNADGNPIAEGEEPATTRGRLA